MKITDRQVDTLRALLLGQNDEYKQLLRSLSEDEVKQEYALFANVAFFEAARKRFRGAKRQDIVGWVANVRATMDTGGRIDPDVAERMLLWAFNKASIDDIDHRITVNHTALLLYLLVEEQQYDEQGLEDFLGRAREIAEQVSS